MVNSSSRIILPSRGGRRDVQIAISILPDGSLRLAFDSKVDFIDLSKAQVRQLGVTIYQLSMARNLHQ